MITNFRNLLLYYWIEIIVITFVCFLTHGLLLLNDGTYHDGWIVSNAVDNGRWDILYTFFRNLGLPLVALFHWVLKIFPNHDFGAHVAIFVSLFLSSVIIFLIAVGTKILSSFEALVLALVFITYPCAAIWVSSAHLYQAVTICNFLAGVFFALIADGLIFKVNPTGFKKNIYNSFALILFFASFFLNSLLVLYFGFIVFWIYLECMKKNVELGGHALFNLTVKNINVVIIPTLLLFVFTKYYFVALLLFFAILAFLSLWENRKKTGDLKKSARHISNFIKKRFLFLILPFVFWALRYFFFYPQKDFNNYNKIKVNYGLVVRYHLGDMFSLLISTNLLFWVLAAVLAVMFLIYSKFHKEENNQNYNQTLELKIIGFGFILWFLCVFPYAVVGRVAET